MLDARVVDLVENTLLDDFHNGCVCFIRNTPHDIHAIFHLHNTVIIYVDHAMFKEF